MSYPQPDPDSYAVNGFTQFRLNTPLISDGDMYESAQGAKAFAIGPDSDISKVNIAYYDEQVGGFMNQVSLTPGRPFPGDILARNDAFYAPSSRPGRTLIWPEELYNPSYVPTQLIGPPDGRIDFVVPVLDVVQYFAPGGLAVTGGRNDKSYEYDFVAVPATSGIWALILPYYGRRYARIFVHNRQAVDLNVNIGGLYYRPGTGINGASYRDIFGGSFVIAASATESQIVRGSTHGVYDALQLLFFGANVNNTTQCPIRILLSDTEV